MNRHASLHLPALVLAALLAPAAACATDAPTTATLVALPADGITARSWAIADYATGRLLAGRDAEVPRKSASTTKIMAAMVVLEFVDADPSVLHERVTFSESAAATGGSRADLATGDSITVGDLLFGLMLPSGNDAGNALAEHFNDRLPPPAEGMGGTNPARSHFIGRMNAIAAGLGMADTRYRISYGDGGSRTDMTTSAADLLTLSRAAMGHALLRRIVSTRGHTATITRADGTVYTRTWTNTNRHLGTPGYVGVKTGTTGQAGSCLVTAYHRDGVPVLVVVLGSAGNDERYSDTRTIIERHFPAAAP